MSGEEALDAEGIVTEALSAKAFRVRLPNGHELVAHVPLRLKAAVAGLVPGDMVTIELSPFDLSVGRITKATKNES